MAYKDILVYADSTEYAAARLDTAAKLAVAHGAHLVALLVDNIPYMPVDLMGTGIAAQVLDWQKSQQKQHAEKVCMLVDEVSQRYGIDIEWRQEQGPVDEIILLQANYADLIVISQPGNPFDLDRPIEPSPGTLAISSGRPVLVVPGRASSYTIGTNIMVAWKPCAEAARAIHDALPLLEKAKTVTLLEVNAAGTAGGRLVGAEMARHLARHGVEVLVSTADEAGSGDGTTILARAAEIGADMIVMGAYGHSRLREVVLGGATNHILKNHHIPVFMAH